ncbi:hypothetical protein Bca4012_076108 [Brassica carinata]
MNKNHYHKVMKTITKKHKKSTRFQIVQCEKYLVWLEGYIPYLDTYNGRTIRYPDLLIRPNNTIKVDLEENKIVEFIKFDVENVVMGSFETIHIQDSTEHEFTTRLGNVFTIGQSNLMRWTRLNGPSNWVESLDHKPSSCVELTMPNNAD